MNDRTSLPQALHFVSGSLVLAVCLVLQACGGGGAGDSPVAPQPVSSPAPATPPATQPPGDVIPQAQQGSSYLCYDTTDGNRCFAGAYPMNAALSASAAFAPISKQLADASSQNAAVMSCKLSPACAFPSAGSASPQSIAMRQAAAAVVRLTMPSQSYIGSGLGGSGVSYTGTCTGTVVRGLDGTNYIVTAGHCMYQAGQSFLPSVYAGTYRSNGIPIHVTFMFEQSTCGAQPDLGVFLAMEATAVPVLSATPEMFIGSSSFGTAFTSGADFAVLQLVDPLPPGVTPIRISNDAVNSAQIPFVVSHPYGLQKSAGVLSRAPVQANGFRYMYAADRRLVEPGSSGAPLLVYDPTSGEVTLRGVLSGANNPLVANTPVCSEPQSTIIFSRIDSNSNILSRQLITAN